jgi:hypothetical protein
LGPPGKRKGFNASSKASVTAWVEFGLMTNMVLTMAKSSFYSSLAVTKHVCIVNLCMSLNMMLWLQLRSGFIPRLCMMPVKGAQNDAIEPATN